MGNAVLMTRTCMEAKQICFARTLLIPVLTEAVVTILFIALLIPDSPSLLDTSQTCTSKIIYMHVWMPEETETSYQVNCYWMRGSDLNSEDVVFFTFSFYLKIHILSENSYFI